MLYRRILAIFLVLASVTLACQATTMKLPVKKLKVGAPQTQEINVPAPEQTPAEVILSFSAGELDLSAGTEGALVTGTATYNIPSLKPVISQDGRKVHIESGDPDLHTLPPFDTTLKNHWELRLGKQPMDLRIAAGAYQGNYKLGGLALQSLEITDGAADTRLEFAEPNPVSMSTLRYETGASKVVLKKLANANFKSMVFRSGAGDYTLDFTGTLQQDADVRIESGISNVVVIVPKGVATRLEFDAGLSNVELHDAWKKDGKRYTLAGSGPTLTITVSMGAGNLELHNGE